MLQHLIIDGYNIINKWPDLIEAKKESIELAREKLNTLVQKYSDFKGIKTAIVYDGKNSKRTETKDNPKIIFSKGGETADTVIEYLVQNHENPDEITVATDDNIQRNFIVGAKAHYISAEDFMLEVNRALADMRDTLERGHPYA